MNASTENERGGSAIDKYELDMVRIEARLLRYNATLAEMRVKAFEVQDEMKLEYLGRVRYFEKIRKAFEKKHRELKISCENVF